MKITTLSIIPVITLISATNASAGILMDLYLGGIFGAGANSVFTENNTSTNTSQAFGANFGIDLPIFRVEAEYNYLHSSEIYANTGILNAYLKLPSTVLIPYVGAGVGTIFSGNFEKQNYTKDIKSTAAYQAMLGVTIEGPIALKFDIEGRALYAPDIFTIDTNKKPDLLQYDLRIKARYIF